MSTVFVIDIDGTICDSIDRVKEIWRIKENEPDAWTDDLMREFLSEENLMNDSIVPGSEIVLELAKKCNASPFFLTGRNDYAREPTRKWLTKIFKAPEETPLIMRPYDQKGVPTAQCKEGLFKKFLYSIYPNHTYIFFEDEDDTAKQYAKYGLVLRSPECWKHIEVPHD